MCTGGGDKTLHDMAQGLEMMTRLRSHHNDLKNLEKKNLQPPFKPPSSPLSCPLQAPFKPPSP